ncbi:MAG: ATP-binding cassette domain-containing protein [Butyrivibrio sp.]
MAIIINNLNIKYDNKIVLKGLNLTVQDGEHVAFTGPSGIGKTSFINALMGLVPYEGDIILPSGSRISTVFQEDRLFEGLSVYRNIKMVCDRQNSDNIKEYIINAGLEPDSKVYALSGGMKRRTSILRAILSPFDILILDEPFKGLDTVTKSDIMSMVQKKASQKTMLLITHDPSEALYFNSRIIDFSSFCD